jgi:glycosyltransferase involved in cell wall biosynthesis
MEAEFREVADANLIVLDAKGNLGPSLILRVVNAMRRMRVDIVQPFLTPATFYSLLSALICNTSVKIITERASDGRKDTGLGYNSYLRAENILSRFADLAVANSKAGAEFLMRRGFKPERVKVIYNGLNLDRLAVNDNDVAQVRRELDVPIGGKVVGMVTRMFPQKRHDIFLKAASIIVDEIPETRFVLIGDGPLRSSLEVMARELGIAAKVAFLGEQRSVAPYISAFDIVVLLSDAEGCSNSILEAMALAKPVVATDVGGNGELIESGKTGFLVPPGNAKEVANAVITLLKNLEFGVAEMVRRYESLYEETLKAKGVW